MRKEVDSYVARLRAPHDPAFDAFADFLPTLPLQQQFNVIRFCVHQNVAPRDPVWMIFALAQQLWTRAAAAVSAAVTPIEQQVTRLNDSAAALTAKALEAARAAERAAQAAKRAPADVQADRDALRQDVREALAAERAALSRTGASWISRPKPCDSSAR